MSWFFWPPESSTDLTRYLPPRREAHAWHWPEVVSIKSKTLSTPRTDHRGLPIIRVKAGSAPA
jgi:hypothetical protein